MIDEGEQMQLGLYLHIPFCQQKCFYCDFPSYANKENLQEQYVTALCNEIALQGGLLSTECVNTVYIGGGTPTALPIDLLIKVIEQVQDSFLLIDDAEFTIEVNPGTVNEEELARLYQVGVNRISFGVQSFQDDLLKRIGRIHTAQMAKNIIQSAAKIGFKNISLDLIYGLPEQTLENVKNSIAEAAMLPINHISIYGLKVEEDTVFAKLAQQDKLNLPSEDEEDAMYEFIMQELPRLGYERYEISNFAKRGFASRHNLKYWECLPYIGMGAAAHSFFGGKRFYNETKLERYIQQINTAGRAVVHEERLDCKALIEEFCFLGLRKQSGVNLQEFEQRFGLAMHELYGAKIARLKKQELLIEREGRIFLSYRGMKYGNQVFCEFLLDS